MTASSRARAASSVRHCRAVLTGVGIAGERAYMQILLSYYYYYYYNYNNKNNNNNNINMGINKCDVLELELKYLGDVMKKLEEDLSLSWLE